MSGGHKRGGVGQNGQAEGVAGARTQRAGRALSRLARSCSCTMRNVSESFRDCHGLPPTSGILSTSTVFATSTSITRGSAGQLGARSFGDFLLPSFGTPFGISLTERRCRSLLEFTPTET